MTFNTDFSDQQSTTSTSSKKSEHCLTDDFLRYGCKKIQGKDRKNVTKFIVRNFLKFVRQNPEKGFKAINEYYIIDLKDYNVIMRDINNIKYNESVKSKKSMMMDEKTGDDKKTKRDYKILINNLAKNTITHILLNNAQRKLIVSDLLLFHHC